MAKESKQPDYPLIKLAHEYERDGCSPYYARFFQWYTTHIAFGQMAGTAKGNKFANEYTDAMKSWEQVMKEEGIEAPPLKSASV